MALAALQEDTVGTAFLPQIVDGSIYLWPAFELGETPSDICLALEVQARAGSVSEIGHPDGWFPVLTWEGKNMGVFIPNSVLSHTSPALLEKSICDTMYPGKKVCLIPDYNVIELS